MTHCLLRSLWNTILKEHPIKDVFKPVKLFPDAMKKSDSNDWVGSINSNCFNSMCLFLENPPMP